MNDPVLSGTSHAMGSSTMNVSDGLPRSTTRGAARKLVRSGSLTWLRLVQAIVLTAVASSAMAQAAFRRGDSNGDGRMDISDPVHTLAFLFLGELAPGCLDAADANDSARIDVSDAVYSLSFLFSGGPAPPAPGDECGQDPTEDGLTCETYGQCESSEGSDIVDGLRLVEGDIVDGGSGEGGGGGHSRDEEDNIFAQDAYRWPNGIVPFVIDRQTRGGLPPFTEASLMAAIAHWESKTPIRFVARTGRISDFLLVQRSASESHCYSSVGRIPGGQIVGLSDGCDTGRIIHELGHAIGLWHEQSRPDRDEFVKIHFENIQPGREHNFEKREGTAIGRYDHGSIMHYGATDFARTGCRCQTIETIPAGVPIGQRVRLSSGDIDAVYYMYGFVRVADSGSQAGAISEVAQASDGSLAVTAVRNGSGDLQVISWRVQADGGLSRLADSGAQAGSASSVDIAHGDRFVTACRNGGGDLLLIGWNVDPDTGAVSRSGDSAGQAGEIASVKIIALSGSLFLTACKNGSGNLFLICWRLNGNGSFTRLGDSGSLAGSVKEFSLTGIGSQVVTAVRNAGGSLLVITWNVSGAGEISRQSDSGKLAGPATMIRAVLPRKNQLVTSLRNDSGNLELITWIIDPNGVIRRRSDSGSQAGAIEDNALMATWHGLVSAVRTEDGTLRLISWDMGLTGELTRRGDSYSLAGAASQITLNQSQFGNDHLILAGARAANGKLLLTCWNSTRD